MMCGTRNATDRRCGGRGRGEKEREGQKEKESKPPDRQTSNVWATRNKITVHRKRGRGGSRIPGVEGGCGKGRSVFVDMTRHAPTRSFRDESQRGKGALGAAKRLMKEKRMRSRLWREDRESTEEFEGGGKDQRGRNRRRVMKFNWGGALIGWLRGLHVSGCLRRRWACL